jgi:hypothetical protein
MSSAFRNEIGDWLSRFYRDGACLFFLSCDVELSLFRAGQNLQTWNVSEWHIAVGRIGLGDLAEDHQTSVR